MTTISLPHGCKPSRACDAGGYRLALGHGWLRKRDDGMWLVATDSFVAVALRLDFPDLVEGVVPYKVLRHLEKGSLCEQVSPTAWRVARGNMVEVTYDVGDRLKDARPPDFDAIAGGAMWAPPTFTTKAKPFAVDPRYVAQIGKAIGGPVILNVTDPGKAIAVRSFYHKDRFGLIMPMKIPVPAKAPKASTKPGARARKKAAA